MKQIVLFWRDPAGNLVKEALDPESMKIHTDGPFVKINRKDGGILRIIPEHKLEMIEFTEEKDESLIVKPSLVPKIEMA